MIKLGITSLTVVVFQLFVGSCSPISSDETKSNSRISSEIWREFTFDWNQQDFDTNLVRGPIIKKTKFDVNGRLRTVTEFPLESDIYKKVTNYDDKGNIKTIETFYSEHEEHGVIEENDNDSKGNPIKKVVISIEDGKRKIVSSFKIKNEYNNGNLVKSISRSEDDTSETYITENSYNENGKIEHAILRTQSGNIVTEIRNAYNRKGLLINQTLSLPHVNKTKEIDIEYIDDLSRIETEKVNGEVQRISDFKYVNGLLSQISVSEAKFERKKVIFIDRKFDK